VRAGGRAHFVHAHTLFIDEREKKRKIERCRICPELLFLFLKGMTVALSPFSYLVYIECSSDFEHILAAITVAL
jgi:hypothetical protein